MLHDGESFIAASPLEAVYRQVDPSVGLHTATDLDSLTLPDVLKHVDNATFSEYDKTRMIIASREIEKRTWTGETGRLYTGFQRLSRVEGQRRIYRKLRDRGLDVHVYGLPDAEPSVSGVTAHGIDADEIGESWFVVYDGDGDDDRKCALLAAESPGENSYRGFWTYRADIVDEILAHLQKTYPT